MVLSLRYHKFIKVDQATQQKVILYVAHPEVYSAHACLLS